MTLTIPDSAWLWIGLAATFSAWTFLLWLSYRLENWWQRMQETKGVLKRSKLPRRRL